MSPHPELIAVHLNSSYDQYHWAMPTSCARCQESKHRFSSLLISTMKPQSPHRAWESLHGLFCTRTLRKLHTTQVSLKSKMFCSRSMISKKLEWSNEVIEEYISRRDHRLDLESLTGGQWCLHIWHLTIIRRSRGEYCRIIPVAPLCAPYSLDSQQLDLHYLH